MPQGYAPEAPGSANDPAQQVAASNRLTHVRLSGQLVSLTWTPTAIGRYPLIDVSSGKCDPAQPSYVGEGDFGVVIVRR